MDIRVLGFKTKMNRAGKPVDWVEYAAAHAIANSTTWARVEDLRPPEEMDSDRDPQGTKLYHLEAVWSFIKPRYEAWKKGMDMPETGTPLSVWPGVNEAEIFELNRAGIKSVEELANSGDGALDKVALPNVREFRKQARMFIEAQATQANAQTIMDLKERQEATEAALAEALEQLKEAQKPKRGRPPKAKTEDEDEQAA